VCVCGINNLQQI